MSGGVDSSVAAALLKELGYQCVGVFMRVGVTTEPGSPRTEPQPANTADSASRSAAVAVPDPRRLRHGCCSTEDALDARAVAGRLGIPFYVLNFQADFDGIIEYFVDEYVRARTPNPCIVCNTRLKFGKLLRYADMLDAEFVATGHYARILRGPLPTPGSWGAGTAERGAATTRGTASQPEYRSTAPSPPAGSGPTASVGHLLARAHNLAKDQSYVLFGIRRQDLPRCLFPLGEISDKATVRRIAADLGLKVHDKPESQEICFVRQGDYRRLVQHRRPGALRAGPIRDASGAVLGQHDGIGGYTIGQRRGLRLATGRPLYVTALDAETHTVTVGSRAELLRGGLLATQVNWLVDPPPPQHWLSADIRIRHQHTPASGRISASADQVVEVAFDRPQAAITPGQAAVFYDPSGIVLGGGWIERALD